MLQSYWISISPSNVEISCYSGPLPSLFSFLFAWLTLTHILGLCKDYFILEDFLDVPWPWIRYLASVFPLPLVLPHHSTYHLEMSSGFGEERKNTVVCFYGSQGVTTLIQAFEDKYSTLTKSVCHPSDGLIMNMMPLEDAPSPHLALQLSFKCAMCQPVEFLLRMTFSTSIQIRMRESRRQGQKGH